MNVKKQIVIFSSKGLYQLDNTNNEKISHYMKHVYMMGINLWK